MVFNTCYRYPRTVFVNFIELKIGVYFFVQVIFNKYDCRFSRQVPCTASSNNSNYATTVSVTSDHATVILWIRISYGIFSMDTYMIFWIEHHYLKIAYLEVGKSRKHAKIDNLLFLFLSSFTWFLHFVPNILSMIVVWNL